MMSSKGSAQRLLKTLHGAWFELQEHRKTKENEGDDAKEAIDDCKDNDEDGEAPG